MQQKLGIREPSKLSDEDWALASELLKHIAKQENENLKNLATRFG